MSRFNANAEEFDPEEEVFDLQQDYQNAVDCLIQCDALFKSFQEQLLAKDDRIVALEEKVMELSLELASVKARQDHQNLKKSEADTAAATAVRSRTNHSIANRGSGRDYRRTSLTSWTSESSNNSNILSNLGQQLMNKSLGWLEAKQQHSNSEGVQVGFPGKQVKNTQSSSEANMLLRRHSTLKKRSSGSLVLKERPLRRSRSSASSCIDGVVFPVSSLEVFSKGCRVERKSKNDTDPRNSEWPNF